MVRDVAVPWVQIDRALPIRDSDDLNQARDQRIDVHTKINRTLATIALVLGIVLMAAVLYITLVAYQRASALGDALGDLGGETTSEVVPAQPDVVQPGDPGYQPFCYQTELGEQICE